MSAVAASLKLAAFAAVIVCAWPAAAAPVVQDQDAAPSEMAPMPTPPAPPPSASTPPAPPTDASPILRIRLRTDNPTERLWLAETLESGLRRSPMSFHALARTPAKVRGETAFRDSYILPNPYRESGGHPSGPEWGDGVGGLPQSA